MFQLGRGAGLAKEQLGFVGTDLISPRYLYGNRPIQLSIACLEDAAKLSLAKLLSQLEVSNRPVVGLPQRSRTPNVIVLSTNQIETAST
jgi:hypothetical protein